MDVGPAARHAAYAGLDGNRTMTFKYAVVGGDRSDDLEYVGTGALDLKRNTLRVAGSGIPAASPLLLPAPASDGSLGAAKDIRINPTRDQMLVTSDTTHPTFVSSGLNLTTGVLTITFSETIDVTPATNVVPAKIHIRESGSYTGGVTLSAGEIDTTADGTTISFALATPNRVAVAGLTAPKLTIEPGAVRGTSGNLIVGTFDISTASYVGSTSVASQENGPGGMAFSNDGTKMFVVGTTGDDVNEYNLTAAFDVSTASPVDVFPVRLQETHLTGITFSNDGTKMFVIGLNSDEIHEYTLPSAFDLSNASYVNGTDISSEDGEPTGMAFSNDGTKMFVVGSIAEKIYEYTLFTAFDASTSTVSADPFEVSQQDSVPTGMAFSNDGAKMFVVGRSSNQVHEYTLSTAFDLSNAFYADSSVKLKGTYSQDVAFSNDGAKMFVVDSDRADIQEYDLSSVYPVTVTGDADITAPVFASSELDRETGVLTVTFSEAIDVTPATNVVSTRIHIRESGNYTGGITLSAGELGTTADSTTISFTLTASNRAAAAGLAVPELTIEPGAVQDTSGNLIVGTFDVSTAAFVDVTSPSHYRRLLHMAWHSQMTVPRCS